MAVLVLAVTPAVPSIHAEAAGDTGVGTTFRTPCQEVPHDGPAEATMPTLYPALKPEVPTQTWPPSHGKPPARQAPTPIADGTHRPSSFLIVSVF